MGRRPALLLPAAAVVAFLPMTDDDDSLRPMRGILNGILLGLLFWIVIITGIWYYVNGNA